MFTDDWIIILRYSKYGLTCLNYSNEPSLVLASEKFRVAIARRKSGVEAFASLKPRRTTGITEPREARNWSLATHIWNSIKTKKSAPFSIIELDGQFSISNYQSLARLTAFGSCFCRCLFDLQKDEWFSTKTATIAISGWLLERRQ